MTPLPQLHQLHLKQVKARAFTLVEVLAVIAVMGILVAILIPVVSSVRNQSQASVNASNLREINKAALMWSNDNGGGVLPTADPSESWPNSFNNWTGLLAPYLGWQGDNEFTRAEDMPVYVNPAYPERFGYGHNYTGLRIMQRHKQDGVKNHARYVNIVDPSSTVFFTTSVKADGDTSFHTGWRSYVRPPYSGTQDHVIDYSVSGDKAMILWLDGHITLETEEAINDLKYWETDETVEL